ncbi:MAG: hypothetical protein JSV16_09395 [Candidatus Hydrogenedentota bacterium]|nr:MAG: hypothetical protein JSV16_09395 [Candidatus Hydrogenedentota bacterium]
MITKTLLVVNGLTGQETPVRVRQGTTPANILRQLGMPNYQLARVKNRQILRQNCDVSRTIKDRERLIAFDKIEVGVL